MIALLLALGSSLAYGCADFLGGLGARRAHVLRTVMIAAPASLAVELLLWPLLGASFNAAVLGWVPRRVSPRRPRSPCSTGPWRSAR